jgi:RNA polymerase sigma factor (sigma-70 family)
LQENPATIQIIEGCRLNQRKAQEQLYRRFYESMMGLCLRYTRNEEDAKEILQNGFLKIFRNIKSYEPGKGALYTWMRSIVIRTAIDFLRGSEKVQVTCELETIQEPEVSNEIIERMDAKELLKWMQCLPAATQAVFNLFVIDGYSHREIAKLLSISEGTSKWHLSEARKRLKQNLQSMEPAYEGR